MKILFDCGRQFFIWSCSFIVKINVQQLKFNFFEKKKFLHNQRIWFGKHNSPVPIVLYIPDIIESNQLLINLLLLYLWKMSYINDGLQSFRILFFYKHNIIFKFIIINFHFKMSSFFKKKKIPYAYYYLCLALLSHPGSWLCFVAPRCLWHHWGVLISSTISCLVLNIHCTLIISLSNPAFFLPFFLSSSFLFPFFFLGFPFIWSFWCHYFQWGRSKAKK